MPAVIDPSACNKNFDQCFPAKICPETAIRLAEPDVVIDSGLCGDCPGPCVNFCDGYAIRFDHDPEAFDIMRGRVLNEISADDALAARNALDEKRIADEDDGISVIDLTSETFETTIRDSTVPVVVDFWASWCGPCKQFAPVFERLSAVYDGRAIFAKVNVDKEPQIASIFGITSIPTLLIFKHAEAVDGAVGAIGEVQLRAMIDPLLEEAELEEQRLSTGEDPAP